jgi:hypothetical protein
MSFQVSTKPVPILNVNKNNRKDSNEYSSTTLIEKYYKANNLDYQRRNDINIFLEKEKQYKSILNSVNQNINTVTEKEKKRVEIEKEKTLSSYDELLSLKSKIITDNIYKHVSIETL